MQQHDSAGMDALRQLGEGFLMAGLAVLVPVHIGQAPEECGVPQVFRHLQICGAVLPLGRPIVHRQFRPCHLPEQRRHIVHFFLERRLIRNLGHIRMMICMIAHSMAVGLCQDIHNSKLQKTYLLVIIFLYIPKSLIHALYQK